MKKVSIYWANGKTLVYTVPDHKVAELLNTLIATKFVNVKLVKIADVEVPVLPSQDEMEALGKKDQ